MGHDIVAHLQHHSGLSFVIIQIGNIDLGIRADLNEVLVASRDRSRKFSLFSSSVPLPLQGMSRVLLNF
ncbi:hypothetical protein ACH79_15790 [Bradyrhizobium sp. CCBAU 051011]|nr:hypothetical protein ACH79_15790 [Bradyrhizobium sp. CCBAU 051011]